MLATIASGSSGTKVFLFSILLHFFCILQIFYFKSLFLKASLKEENFL